jgi:hypothetical protein
MKISSYMTAVDIFTRLPAQSTQRLRATMSRTGERFRVMDPEYLRNSGILDNPQTYIPQKICGRLCAKGGVCPALGAKVSGAMLRATEYFDVRDLPAGETGYVIAGGATASVAQECANQAVKMTAYVIENRETAQLLKQEARLNSRHECRSLTPFGRRKVVRS